MNAEKEKQLKVLILDDSKSVAMYLANRVMTPHSMGLPNRIRTL